MAFNYKPIEDKLTQLIKQVIQEKGLVGTGRMLNSIKVVSVGDDFKVIAVDYFPILDKQYKIVETATNKPEFARFVEDQVQQQLIDPLKL